MNFQQRSFNSQLFRPRPEVAVANSGEMLVVATPWGPRPAATKVIEIVQDYFLATRNDDELTSPFEQMSCLSYAANNLRTAALLANDWLYREENRNEYVCGVELFAASISQNELVWLHAGAPQVFLSREGRGIVSLASSCDLTFDLSQKEFMPPLPAHLLGLDHSANLTMNSFRPRPGDQLILLSRSTIPPKFFSLTGPGLDLEQIVKILASENGELPFWVGLWSL